MPSMDALIQQCAPAVSPILMQALVRAESSGDPLAIGVDGKQAPVPRPRTLEEAVTTAKRMASQGAGFSVGLAQVHASNVRLYGLSWAEAFDPCRNLAVGQKILWNFYHRASASGYSGVAAVWAALRGYNSGRVDRAISDEYANRVFAYMGGAPPQVQIAPEVAATSPDAPAGQSIVRSPLEHSAPALRSRESLDIFGRAASSGL